MLCASVKSRIAQCKAIIVGCCGNYMASLVNVHSSVVTIGSICKCHAFNNSCCVLLRYIVESVLVGILSWPSPMSSSVYTKISKGELEHNREVKTSEQNNLPKTPKCAAVNWLSSISR